MMDKQQQAIKAINEGKSIFLSGAGGFGKSWVIEQCINYGTVIGAQTTVAARNVGGETVNSLFGLPFGIVTDEDRDNISYKVRKLFSGDAVTRIVLDEVSTLRCDKLDLIDHRLRTIKEVDKPFGGIQVILVGDLFQIPSIIQKEEKRPFRRMYSSPHVFMAKVWKELNPEVITLTEPKRNENVDQVHLLEAIRVKDKRMVKGKPLYQHAIDRVNGWAKPDTIPSELHLCSYLSDAKKRNAFWYDQIEAPEHIYRGIRTGTYAGVRAPVDDEMRLKVGLQVVLCANDKEKQFINGDRGIIKELGKDEIIIVLLNGDVVCLEHHQWEKYEYVRSMSGLERKTTGTYNQYPIKLGYAMSIHKCQGMTLDSVTIDLGKGAFAPAMLYVGLSRVRDLKNVALTRKIDYDDCIVDKKVQKFYSNS